MTIELTPHPALAKSNQGLWIRATRRDDVGCIRVEYQTRVVIRHGRVVHYDENKDVLSDESVRECGYNPRWITCGDIPLDHEFWFRLPRQRVLSLQHAVMRHVCALIALGWGESSAEVVQWFALPLGPSCLVPGVYDVVRGVGVFDSLDGATIQVQSIAPLQLTINVNHQQEFEVHELDEQGLLDFLESTSPVQSIA